MSQVGAAWWRSALYLSCISLKQLKIISLIGVHLKFWLNSAEKCDWVNEVLSSRTDVSGSSVLIRKHPVTKHGSLSALFYCQVAYLTIWSEYFNNNITVWIYLNKSETNPVILTWPSSAIIDVDSVVGLCCHLFLHTIYSHIYTCTGHLLWNNSLIPCDNWDNSRIECFDVILTN